MAILVFTDFACLFPIAFFGLTAAAGKPLITLTESKILLVFFFPLNACANPFLYAITTQQFKKDLYSTLGRCGFCQKRTRRYRGPYGNTFHSSSNNPHSRACCTNATGNYVHRSSQGSVRSTFISSKFSSSTKSHGSHATPSSSPKTCKKKMYDCVMTSSTTSSTASAAAPPVGKYQAVLCASTAVGISKDLRKLSVVPEASPKRVAAAEDTQDLEEGVGGVEQQRREEQQEELEEDGIKMVEGGTHEHDDAGGGDAVNKNDLQGQGQDKGQDEEIQSLMNGEEFSDESGQVVGARSEVDEQAETGQCEIDQDDVDEMEEDQETTEMVNDDIVVGRPRTVRSVSQYSAVLGKQGSVEYERFGGQDGRGKGRKTSQATSTCSGSSVSSAGSTCTETSLLPPLTQSGSLDGNNTAAAGIDTIQEEEQD